MERHKLLFHWNQTWRDYPRDSCFHHLMEAEAARAPEAIALESPGERLTYSQLNARANHLAHHLQLLGVAPEVLVGICLEPSVGVLIALLAILKAGGAYVPLDPAYPSERRAFMVRDSGMRVIVTQESLRASVASEGAQLVSLDALPPAPSDWRDNPVSEVQPENLAYVIYTSGSTGTPKGVMVPHRGLVNYLCWAVEAYQMNLGTGAPVHSSLSFDLTVTGLLAPLIAGRCVHMLPPDEGLETLANVLRRPGHFSLVKITPAHLEMLCAQLTQDETATATRLFIVGGEALFGEQVKSWRRCAPDAIVVNEYGPTETVVGCCVYFVPKEKEFSGAIPIGRPIANTQLYVLNENLQPVPIGEAGELYIAGDGVARGYLHRPELTAEHFVTNPFAAEDAHTSSRMYKTGDLVRYLPDGNLEFLGRIDNQIKIRSYRIEPAEIESVLLAHPLVRQAVVLAHAGTSDDKYLVAYLAFVPGRSLTSSELREYLAEQLPEYMIPATFISLPSLPLTVNGKIDRRALPLPETGADSSFIAPQTETECKVAEIWREMFQRSQIGLRDSFFEMGGHSLLAVRLVTQINDVFRSDLDAITLLENPTVETLARALHARNCDNGATNFVRLCEGDERRPVIFLNTPFDFIRLATPADGQAVYASHIPWSEEMLRASARGDTADFPTVAEMAAPHVALILENRTIESCVIAGYSYGGVLAFEVAHQLARRKICVEAVVLFDCDLKLPRWEKIKRRARHHASNVRREGIGYLWRTAQQRIARTKKVQAENRALAATAETNDFSNPETRWDSIDRIWRYAIKHYRPRRLPSHGILLRAEETFYDPSQDFDGVLGWSRRFAGGLEMIRVPGDHHTMWKEPYVRKLSDSWKCSLRKLRRNQTAFLPCAPPVVAALL